MVETNRPPARSTRLRRQLLLFPVFPVCSENRLEQGEQLTAARLIGRSSPWPYDGDDVASSHRSLTPRGHDIEVEDPDAPLLSSPAGPTLLQLFGGVEGVLALFRSFVGLTRNSPGPAFSESKCNVDSGSSLRPPPSSLSSRRPLTKLCYRLKRNLYHSIDMKQPENLSESIFIATC